MSSKLNERQRFDISKWIPVEESLPDMDVVVKACCRMGNGPYEYKDVKRIKSETRNGWQWSSASLDTYFTGTVLKWNYPELIEELKS